MNRGQYQGSHPTCVPRKTAVGFTLVEILITAILIAALIYTAQRILSFAHLETQKGYWLQQRMTELRNATRAISLRMKKTSYPSTVLKEGTTDYVISFKEWRRYDDGARLRDLQINPSDEMDMKALEGTVFPRPERVSLMRFPICKPEKEGGPGTITWIELVLDPDLPFLTERPLGKLKLVERVDTYSTRAPKYAFGYTGGFSPSLPINLQHPLVDDVATVRIASFSVDELRGIMVAESGSVAKKFRRRSLVSVRIDCQHPYDEKITISDQCTVVANVDVAAVGGGMSLIVVAINGVGAAATADLKFNGTPITANAGTSLGSGWTVTSVFANGVVVKHSSGISRAFYKRPG